MSPLKIASNYGQYPINFLAFSNPDYVLILFPNISIDPNELVNSPVRHLKQVVLPAPDTPNKAKHSPFSTLKEISLIAFVLPNYFYIWQTLTGICFDFIFSTFFASLIISFSDSLFDKQSY